MKINLQVDERDIKFHYFEIEIESIEKLNKLIDKIDSSNCKSLEQVKNIIKDYVNEYTCFLDPSGVKIVAINDWWKGEENCNI